MMSWNTALHDYFRIEAWVHRREEVKHRLPWKDYEEVYIAVMVDRRGDGNSVIQWIVCDPTTGAKKDQGSLNFQNNDFSLSDFVQADFYIGYSNMADLDANAEYNEVRIWKGVLSDADIARNVKLGPEVLTADTAYASTKNAEPDIKQAPTAEKAKTRVVLFPRLDRSPTAWSYSFEAEKNWNQPNFDDSGWKRAPGGFGRRVVFNQLRHARLNVEWGTKKLFLRKRFQWDGGEVSRAVVDAYHDDDMTVWLNGWLMMTNNDTNSDWQPYNIPARRFNKALKKGVNVLCVEVRNNAQSQYFDCGLLVECDGASVPHAGPDRVRMVETSSGIWTVQVVNGIAQLGNGTDVALNPRPRGRLVIPSELDGIAIRKLAPNCFRNCNEAESVVIPEGVTSVGEAAFFGCKHLSDVTVPETLEHLGSEALNGTSLKRIDLKNTRLLEGSVFKFCKLLDMVHVNPGNLTFALKDGVLYDKGRRAVVFCPRSKTSYAFPLGVEEVYASAFMQCKIKSIVIPETVKVVWDCAFEGCPLLESVKFNGDDVLLGGWSFGNNPSLKSIALPVRQKSLEARAIFTHAERLETITLPDTVETVGVSVFENCSRLKKVNLGKSLRTVRQRAFAGCPQMDDVKFKDALKALGAQILYDPDSTKAVQLALDALFPGWTTTQNESRTSRPRGAKPLGFVKEFNGRRNLVCTLPIGKSVEPVVLQRRMTLPSKNPHLKLSFGKDLLAQSDFRLQVCVNKKSVCDEKVEGSGWRDMSIPLTAWAGEDVTLEVRQYMLPGNPWGRVYWSNLEVTEDD